MRILVVSDLHSNLEGLQAVLAAAQGEYTQVVCCGDLVGYGPDPNSIVDWVRGNVSAVVRGNHDKVCCGIDDAAEFNEVAKAAAYWTRGQLTPENLQYLRDLLVGPLEVMGRFTILHGSPWDEDEYITASWEAAEVFQLLTHPVSFFGHTHLQGGFFRALSSPVQAISIPVGKGETRRVMELKATHTYYVNPGSVGQPRDGDSRAGFAIYDTAGFIEFGRTAYDLESTANKMRQVGLPELLARRLSLGR
ncbi:MAG: metallophosphoesterase family protein [Acidobacteria bacterium]|nr:metallophosphoesterase family protein [Acidobacteriota bacterium]